MCFLVVLSLRGWIQAFSSCRQRGLLSSFGAGLCLVTQSCPTLFDPMDCSPPGSSVHGDFSRQEYWSGLPCLPPGDFPNPGIEPRSPALQVDSLPSEPPGKPQNTGVGSLSLRQGNFLIQELNRVLLHCRWILYQLSYQGSPVRAGPMRNFAAAWSIPPLNHPAGV